MNKEHSFFIKNGRAMISLGKFRKSKYCPYSCAFCYVQGDFKSYPSMENEEIIEYLKKYKDDFEIIYISGDTDSFAFPRTKKALELLNMLCENFDVDIQFTTRTCFTNEDLEELSRINSLMKLNNRKLIGSISIPRLYSANHIEPKPIPSPEERIEQLKKLKEIGIITMLAMRPLLPIIDISEYKKLIDKCKPYTDIVLGESWYANEEILNKVFINGIPDDFEYSIEQMDFDDNTYNWKCWEPKKLVNELEEYCILKNIKFFMRSKNAIEYLNGK